MPVLFGTEVRSGLAAGINKLATAVQVTLGPRGRNVCMEKAIGAPLITKDGVSVAKEIELPDRWENMGARLVLEVASTTSDSAGDGTTTATVLANAMVQDGLKMIEAGMSPVAFKRGMDKALFFAEESIRGNSLDVSTPEAIRHVATVSANGDEKIGKVLSEAIVKIGKDGIVNIEEGRGIDIVLETIDGMKLDRGMASAQFATDPVLLEATLYAPKILVTDNHLSYLKDLAPLLDALVAEQQSLVIIAPDFSPEVMTLFTRNKLAGNLSSLLIKAPGFGAQQDEILQDIAVLTGATFVTAKIGMTLSDVTPEHFGSAERVVSSLKHTFIYEGRGREDALKTRIKQLRGMIDRTASVYDADKIKDRVARLQGGICVIKIGAHTEIEMKEIKARVEDALFATKASLTDGIVPGGGAALLWAGKYLEDVLVSGGEDPSLGINRWDLPEGPEELAGYKLVASCCRVPMVTIINNGGELGQMFARDVLGLADASDFAPDPEMWGVDARTFEFKNMIDAEIIDPTAIVLAALKTAVSVASTVLTTEAGIYKPEVAAAAE